MFTVNILNSEVTDDWCVKVRTFTVVPNRFTNANILLQWIDHFKNIIPYSNKGPVLFSLMNLTSTTIIVL